MKRLLIIVVLVCLSSYSISSTIIVQNTNDHGLGSLRDAVNIANSGDTIRFDPNIIAFGNKTIFLDSAIKTIKSLTFIGVFTNTDTLFVSHNQPSNSLFKMFDFASHGSTVVKIHMDSMAMKGRVFSSGYNLEKVINIKGDKFSLNNSIFKNFRTAEVVSIQPRNSASITSFYNVMNTKFYNNEVGRGGTLSVSGSDYNLGVKNCSFIDNKWNSAMSVYAQGDPIISIENCVFENNHINSGNYGAALNMYLGWGKNVTLNNLTFKNNHSNEDGGAMYVYFPDSRRELTLKKCVFENNTASGSGGALFLKSNTIYNTFFGYYNLENCDFKNNRANSNGGAIGMSSKMHSQIKIDSTIFSNDSAINGSGGAFYNSSGYGTFSGASISSIEIQSSSFTHNFCGSTGGAIRAAFTDGINYDIKKSIFEYNRSNNSGGAIYNSSGNAGMLMKITECEFSHNSSFSTGGAIEGGNTKSYYEINKSTFNHNISRNGGVIMDNTSTASYAFQTFYPTYIEVVNSTFYKNFVSQNGASIKTHNSSTIAHQKPIGEITLKNSTFYENSSINGGSVYATANGIENLRTICQGSILVKNGNNGNFYCDTVFSNGYNLFGDTILGANITDQHNVSDVALNLDTLKYNGGFAKTLLPKPTSIALNAGWNIDLSDAQNRPIIGIRDIGAAEYNCQIQIPSSVTTCPNSYSWKRTTITTPGIYKQIAIQNFGCDSVYSLTLNFHPTSFSTIVDTACVRYTTVTGKTIYNSGIYQDTLSSILGCDSIISYNIHISNLTKGLIVNPSRVTLQTPVAGANYQWLDCNNGYAIISGDTNSTFIASNNGSYSVEINKNGCIDTSNCYSIHSVGFDKKDILNQIILFPNPNNGIFNLDLGKKTQLTRIFITDLNGRLIKEITSQNVSQYEINFEGVPGVYFLNIIGENERKTLKLIKK